MSGSVLIAKDRKMNNTDSLSSMARSPFGRRKWKRSWKTKKLQPQRYIQNILGKKKNRRGTINPGQEGRGNIREGFLEERTPELSHERQMGSNKAKEGRVFQAVGTA